MNEVTVRANERVGEGLHAITLDVGDLASGYTVPGQYVQLAAGEGKPAFMAIASAPGADGFEFLIQYTDGMAGQICKAQAGHSVQCSAVIGNGFTVSELDGRDVLFFAGGTGISAVRAVIESRNSWGGDSRIYYGARSPDHMAYQDKFADWAARGVRVVATLDEPADGFESGFPQDVYARDPLASGENAALVLCGPGPMCQGATDALVAAGMPAERALKNY
ncbi:MAG: hypothetical protein GY913_25260 [Proteobacteria bacterium]|nr:hypothetical protein [Pseudomonadota bacterium]MCP4920223.1 hypothetical protein [Pseudomonadota bacterium]